jgi:ketosteroid isomerase-like protein
MEINQVKAEIERLTQAWVKADNDKDVEGQISFLAPNVEAHMSNSPVVKGIEANRKMAEEFMTGTGFWTFTTTELEVSKSEDMAYLTGTYHFTTSDWKADSYYDESLKGKEIVDDGKMILIWRKFGDAWKIVVYSSVSDLPSK